MRTRTHLLCAVAVTITVAACLVAIPGSIAAQVPDDFGGFRIEGRHLYDAHGNKVVLVGINKMVIWTDRDGIPAFPEIARTGANAVRVVWLTEGSAEELDIALTNAITHKLIPIVDCHDSTGKWGLISKCVDYWVRPDVAAVLKRHESYLLLNIANEAGSGVEPPLRHRAAYELAIRRIRATGLHLPLVIDAQGWGQGIDELQLNGPYLLSADPDHNVMFSIHMWWPSSSRGPNVAQEVIDEIAQSVEMELPLLIGEFANKGPGCTCCIPYRTIIEEAHRNEIGYLPWSWGPGNGDCAEMDMTADGTFNTLQNWGLEVAITSPHSIQAIAVRPDWIVAATPVPAPTPAPTPTPLPAPEGLLSIGRPVTASSVEREEHAPSAAVDGRLNTRWSSEYSDPQEIVVDLGEVREIGRIVLEWETAYGREYKLQVSVDGVDWIDLVEAKAGSGGRDDHVVSASARYVKMLGLRRGTEWGYSLWEFWIFDSADRPLPEPDPQAQVSSVKDPRPDLVVGEISWTPDPVAADAPFTLQATVTNVGSGTAYRDHPVRIVFEAGGEVIAAGELDRPLAPDGSTVITAEAPAGSLTDRHPDLRDGFIVLAWVDHTPGDPAGVVDEADEANNLATAYGKVEAEPTPSSTPTETTPTVTVKPTPEPLAGAGSGLLPAPSPGRTRLIVAGSLVLIGVALGVTVRRRRRGARDEGTGSV